MTSLFEFDKKAALNFSADLLAGIDEAGRGPLAGPVVAAAVMLPQGFKIKGLADSKKLSEKKRNIFFKIIKKSSISVGVGIVENFTIDRINIYRASLLAMQKAAAGLSKIPDAFIIDGPFRLKGVKIKQIPVIGGDNKSACVASASIIAKVTRDRLMKNYDKRFPGYGFAKHKGYGTREHYHALKKLGPCPLHRKTFRLL